MILFELLTLCAALKWSKTGIPLNKTDRREAKSQIRSAKERSSQNDHPVDIWFADTNRNSKCSLRDEAQEGVLFKTLYGIVRFY